MSKRDFYDSTIASIRVCTDDAIEIELKPEYVVLSVKEMISFLDKYGYDVIKREPEIVNKEAES